MRIIATRNNIESESKIVYYCNMKNIKILILLFTTIPLFSYSQSKLFKVENISIFSGMGINKVYDWEDVLRTRIGSEFKRDFTNIGIGLSLKLNRNSSLLLNFNYVQKGALVEKYQQNYIFKYSIISPSYQHKIIKNYLKINAGLYLGYLHDYILNNIIINMGKDLDFGYNLALESEVKLDENLSFFFNPIVESGLIKFSNSKQFSIQFRYGIKYILSPR